MSNIPTRGQVVAERYRLIRELGRGAMGTVWLAEHVNLRASVAIKFIHSDAAGSAESITRFRREARSAAALRSPHVVQVLDHGIEDGLPYLAMELLDGQTLRDRLAQAERLAPGETARIVTHIARAVSRAHTAGLLHRDLKPENVFLTRDDDEPLAKVLDFGLTKSTALCHSVWKKETQTGVLFGTPNYMSPEQIQASQELDHRSDLWALGVIAFECLLGRRPFDGDNLLAILCAVCSEPLPIPSRVGSVPRGFDEWFAKACARDPRARFQSAKQAAAELSALCSSGFDEEASSVRVMSRATLSPASDGGLAAPLSAQPRPFAPRAAAWLCAALVALGSVSLWQRLTSSERAVAAAPAPLRAARPAPSAVLNLDVPSTPPPVASPVVAPAATPTPAPRRVRPLKQRNPSIRPIDLGI